MAESVQLPLAPNNPGLQAYPDQNGADPLLIPLGIDAAGMAPDAWPEPSITEIPARRSGEWVRQAPNFPDQVRDLDRTNPVTYVAGMRRALDTRTEGSRRERPVSEHEGLVELQKFLQDVRGNGAADATSILQAASMMENLTFIGDKEYREFVTGIPNKWRSMLRDDPELKICAVVGKIDPSLVKSDSYLLDNILKQFSDEELAGEFAGRILTSPSQLVEGQVAPEHAAVVLLDDWIASGKQMRTACTRVLEQFPEYATALQVQVIAAPKAVVQAGMRVEAGSAWDPSNPPIAVTVPVDTYFVAHDAREGASTDSGVHITGSKSAVAFGFNSEISEMAQKLAVDMPPLTNIVRTYRTGPPLVQTTRLR